MADQTGYTVYRVDDFGYPIEAFHAPIKREAVEEYNSVAEQYPDFEICLYRGDTLILSTRSAVAERNPR